VCRRFSKGNGPQGTYDRTGKKRQESKQELFVQGTLRTTFRADNWNKHLKTKKHLQNVDIQAAAAAATAANPLQALIKTSEQPGFFFFFFFFHLEWVLLHLSKSRREMEERSSSISKKLWEALSFTTSYCFCHAQP